MQPRDQEGAEMPKVANREEMVTAMQQSCSCAPKFRARMATLLAALIVAVALFVAMPSLASAATPDDTNGYASTSQEISPDISSVDIQSDTSATPTQTNPMLSPQASKTDVYESTSEPSGVEVVSGAGSTASNAHVNASGNASESSDDEDADIDSTLESDTADSTSETEDNTTNAKIDEPASTAGSSTSNSTDVIATPEQESADLTGATSSEMADVIATPAEMESADLNGKTAENVEMLAEGVSVAVSDIILSPAATWTPPTSNVVNCNSFSEGGDITLYLTFHDGDSNFSPVYLSGESASDNSPIFDKNGNYLCNANQVLKITGLKASTVLGSFYRYGVSYGVMKLIIPGRTAGTYAYGGKTVSNVQALSTAGNTVKDGQNLVIGGYISTNWKTLDQIFYDPRYGTQTDDFKQYSITNWMQEITLPEINNLPSPPTGYTYGGWYYGNGNQDTLSGQIIGPIDGTSSPVLYEASADATPVTDGETFRDVFIRTFGSDYSGDRIGVPSLVFMYCYVPIQDDTPDHTVTFVVSNDTNAKFADNTTTNKVYTGKPATDVTWPGTPTNTDTTKYFVGWNSSSSATKATTTGWYNSTDHGTFTSLGLTSTTEAQSITLYAIWADKYVVKFYANNDASGSGDGQLLKTVYVVPGTATNPAKLKSTDLPTVEPSRSHYDFKGWNTSKTATAGIDVTTISITDDTKIYAVWEKQWEVTFNANGGEIGGSTDAKVHYVSPGSSISTYNGSDAPKATRSGYRLAGWYTSATVPDGATLIAAGAAYTPTADVTLYAVWVQIIDVIYQPNGGKINNSASNYTHSGVDAGPNYVILGTDTVNPTREGYKFKGWKFGTVTNPFSAGDKITVDSDNRTLVAQWEVREYTVKFYPNGASNADLTSAETTIKWDTSLTSLPDPGTKTGDSATSPQYEFKGWYTKEGGAGVQADTTKKGEDYIKGTTGTGGLTETSSEIVFYAYWQRYAQIKVTYNAGKCNGLDSSATVPAQVMLNKDSTTGESVSAYTVDSSVPVWNGYEFLGWKSSSDDSSHNNQDYAVGENIGKLTKDVTLTAQWRAYSVTIKFMNTAGTASAGNADIAGTIGVATDLHSSTATADGYKFTGWAKNTTEAAAGTVVFPVDTSWSYTPTAGDGIVSLDDTHKTATATFYAVFEKISYTIKFDPNYSGSTTTSNTGFEWTGTVVGSPLSSPILTSLPALTRNKYTLDGWYTNSTADGSALKLQDGTTIKQIADKQGKSTADTTLTVYAKWIENTVTITYGVDAGSANHVDIYVGTEKATGQVVQVVGIVSGDVVSTQINGVTHTTAAANPAALTAGVKVVCVKGYENPTWSNGSTTTNEGTFVAPHTADASFTVSVTPKKYKYRIEYYTQDADLSGYSLAHSEPGYAGAPLDTVFSVAADPDDWTVSDGGSYSFKRTAGLNGFTYNHDKTFAENNGDGTMTIQISVYAVTSDALENILKIYFNRNSSYITIKYEGIDGDPSDIPDGITPANTVEVAGSVVTIGTSGSKVAYGNSVTVANPAAVTGYTFRGWKYQYTLNNVDSGLQNLTANSFSMPDTDLDGVTIIGYWQATKYSVTYYNSDISGQSNYGSIIWNGSSASGKTEAVKHGCSPVEVPTPTPKAYIDNPRVNYAFVGWRVGNTTEYIQNPATELTVTSNVQLYAIWSTPVIVTYAPGLHAPTTSWKVSSNVITKDASDKYVVGSATNSTFSYLNSQYSNAYTDNVSGSRNYGKPLGADGYVFIGWDTDQNATTPAYASLDLSGVEIIQSTTFYAIWEATTQHMIFELVDPALPVTTPAATLDSWFTTTGATATTGETYTLPDATEMTIPGYTLVKWLVNGQEYNAGSDFTVTSGTFNAASGNWEIVFTPQFSEDKVTITYAFSTGCSGMGSIVLDGTPASGTVSGTSITNIPAATGSIVGATAAADAGYTFLGWYDAEENRLTTDATYTPSQSGGKWVAATYYAKFEANKYTVEFEVEEVSSGVFNGYFNGDTNKLGVYYNGTTEPKVTYKTNVKDIVPTVHWNNGYQFDHWEYTISPADGSADVTGTISVADLNVNPAIQILGNARFVAVFTELGIFTVHYDCDGGSSIADKTNVGWGTAVIPANPTKAGWSFGGWRVDNATTNLSDSATYRNAADAYALANPGAVADSLTSITLYAQWDEVDDYIVKYVIGHGTDPAQKEGVTWAQTGLLPAGFEIPTAAGYKFNGWWIGSTKVDNDMAYSYLADNEPETMFITLTASWTPKTYTINYVDTDGTTVLLTKEVNWDTTLDDNYNYKATKTLDNKKYTMKKWMYSGGTKTANFTEDTATNPRTTVADLAGNDDSQTTLTLQVIWNISAAYAVHIFTVDYDKTSYDAASDTYTSTKTPVEVTSTFSGDFEGAITAIGSALDYTALGADSIDYSIYKVLGYAFDRVEYVVGGIVQTNPEAQSDTTYIVNIYLKEKTFEVNYDITSNKPAGTTITGTPATRHIAWNDTNLAPNDTPRIAGYNDPIWKDDREPSGADTAGKSVGDLLGTNDSGINPITLYAYWTMGQVTISYVAGEGGSITSTPATETVPAIGGIASLNGATAAPTGSSYIFDGWYYTEGGVEKLASTSLTFTPNISEFAGGVLVDRTYTAKFHDAADNIPYEVIYYYENTDGTTYTETRTTKYGTEGGKINAAALGYEIHTPGFTLDKSVSGTNDEISVLSAVAEGVDLPAIVLYYARNAFNVNVTVSYDESDAGITELPDVMATSEVTALKGSQYFDTTHALPNVNAASIPGWNLEWVMTYRDENNSTQTVRKNDGESFTIPAAYPGSEISIVANWTRKPFTVKFVSNAIDGSNGHGSITSGGTITGVKYNTVLTADQYASVVVAPDDASWELTGWKYYLDEEKTIEKGPIDPVTDGIKITYDNFIFYAVWSQTLTVKYQPGGKGSSIFNEVKIYDEIANGSDLPHLVIGSVDYNTASETDAQALATPGYKVLGWTWNDGTSDHTYYYDGRAGSEAMPTKVNRSMSFMMLTEANEYTLTFTLGETADNAYWTDDTADHTATLAMGGTTSTFLTGADIKRDGWNLDGWYVEGDDSVVYNAGRPFTLSTAGNVTFLPKWSFDKLTINFAVDGKGGIDKTKYDVKEDTTSVVVVATPDAGYQFDGWFYADGTQVGATGTESVTDSTLTLTKPATAWAATTYTAKFSAIVDGSNITVEYWFEQSDGTFAHDDADNRTITGTAGTEKNYSHADHGPVPAKSGYDYSADATDANGGIRTIESVNGDGTSKFVVYYVARKYNVFYEDALAGTGATAAGIPGTAHVLWDAAVAVPADPTKEGYTFAGWTTDEAGTAPYTAAQVYNTLIPAGMTVDDTYTNSPTAGITLFAQWIQNVVINVNVYKTDEFGNVIKVPVSTALDGKTFVSVKDAHFTGAIVDGKLTATGTAAQGYPFGSYDLPVIAGYHFDNGQIFSSNRLIDGASNTVAFGYDIELRLADDGTLFLELIYLPNEEDPLGNKYTVEYYDEDGVTKLGEHQVANWASTHLAMDPAPVKGGFKLKGYGWKMVDGTQINATTAYYDVAQGNVNANVVKLIAMWAGCTYNINYVDQDATTTKYISSSINAGAVNTINPLEWTEAVSLTDPALADTLHETGYKFIGWTLDAANTIAANGVIPAVLAGPMNFGGLVDALNALKGAGTFTSVMDDVYDADHGTDGITLYAVWAKYIPYTVEYWTDDAAAAFDTENGEGWEGMVVTVPYDHIWAKRPNGYSAPTGDYQRAISESDNVLKIYYEAIKDFKLILDANGGAFNDFGGATVWTAKNDLNWNSTISANDVFQAEYNGVTYELKPVKFGYNIADFDLVSPTTVQRMQVRWNALPNGDDAHAFVDQMTYAQLAALIYGDAINDTEIRANGLRLYAQWIEKQIYKVDYNLNNNKETNEDVTKDVPNQELLDDEKTEGNFGWNKDIYREDGREIDGAPLGYEFDSWNTKADGTGLRIEEPEKVTFGDVNQYVDPDQELPELKLYAQWRPIQIMIKYESEDENKGTVSRDHDYVSAVDGSWIDLANEGDEFRLTSVATAKPGYHFVRWELVDENGGGLSVMAVSRAASGNDWGTGNDLGIYTNPNMWIDDVSNDPTRRLYGATYRAIFDENDPATIVYEANDGEGLIESVTKPHGSLITLSDGKGFTRSHYTLVGWNTKADGTGTEYALGMKDFEMPKAEDTDGVTYLYAMWELTKYPVNIKDTDDEKGKVKGGSTDVVWGDPLDPEFIDKIKVEPKPGKLHVGWTYTMTDADTGEVITGTITDLSELQILGPVELTPIYEDDPNYVGPNTGTGSPKTGDDVTGIVGTGFLAAIALAVMLFAWRRRKDEDDDTDPEGNTNGVSSFFGRSSRLQGSVSCFACALLLAGAIAILPATALAATSSSGGSSQSTTQVNKSNAAKSDPATSTGSLHSNGAVSGASASKHISKQADATKKLAVKNSLAHSNRIATGGADVKISGPTWANANGGSGVSAARAGLGASGLSAADKTADGSRNLDEEAAEVDPVLAIVSDVSAMFAAKPNADKAYARWLATISGDSGVAGAAIADTTGTAVAVASVGTNELTASDTSAAVGNASASELNVAARKDEEYDLLLAQGLAPMQSVMAPGAEVEFPDDPGETVDAEDPEEGTVDTEEPGETQKPGEDPAEEEKPGESEQPETSEPVKVSYVAGVGGSVTNNEEDMSAITGDKVDSEGETRLLGATALPDLGYHFTGWTVKTASAENPDKGEISAEPLIKEPTLDASIIKKVALDVNKKVYKAVDFVSNFAANTYNIAYDANGGKGELSDTLATYGKDDTVLGAASVSKDGYEFTGWNTSEEGTGTALKGGDVLTASKIQTLIQSDALQDEDGATTTLYAQWAKRPDEVVVNPSETPSITPPADVVNPGNGSGATEVPNNPGVVTPPANTFNPSVSDDPVPALPVDVLPGMPNYAHATTVGSAASNAAGGAVSNVVAGIASAAASQGGVGAVFDGAVEALGELPLPPALEVFPVAAEALVTVPEHLKSAEGGLLGALSNLTAAEATQVAGTTVATVAAVGAVAGIAGTAAFAAGRAAAATGAAASAAGVASGAAGAVEAGAAGAAAVGAAGSAARRLRRKVKLSFGDEVETK